MPSLHAKPIMLSREQVAAYRADGFLVPLPALGDADVARYRAAVESFIAAGSGDMAATMKQLRTKAHLRCPGLVDVVRTPLILDQVADILGPDVLCRGSSIFMKEPGAPTHIAWHQDAGYWWLDPPDVITAWVALAESTIENGALEMLPGSHLKPLLNHEIASIPGNMLSRGQVITDEIDPKLARPLLLRPGQMSLHHMGTAHRSKPNRSTARRIGVAIRYVAAHVRNTGEHRDSAMLVRGQDRYGHFLPEAGEILVSG